MRVRSIAITLASLSIIVLTAFALPALAQTETPTPAPTLTPGGDCCANHAGPGCDIDACEACVCDELEPFCCNSEGQWDDICAAIAESDDCSSECQCGDPPTPTPTPGGDCCTVHEGSRCDDETCTSCVCAVDSNCCNGPWDDFCVETARTVDECQPQCSFCSPLPTVGPLPTPTPGPCCEARTLNPGCNESVCESCVCDVDENCCLDTWDEVCTIIAVEECAFSCDCPQDGDCCEASEGFGCGDRRCQECVLGLDPDCVDPFSEECECGNLWDANCASQAQLECALDCPCGDCCSENLDEVPGCGVKTCQDCVCEADPNCCSDDPDLFWDAQCAAVAREDCSVECPCGDCCLQQQVAGCGEEVCQECVCALDSNCCDADEGIWDGICVAQASTGDCANRCSCEPPSNCCVSRPDEAGCEISECEACICAIDSFCCDELWDSGCAEDISVSSCQAECGCAELPPASDCAGDCDGDGNVAIGELIVGVRIALGRSPVSSCFAFDTNGDGDVRIGELIQGVRSALEGC